jgi:hypothetical protein
MGIKQADNIIVPIKIMEYNSDRDTIEMVDQITHYKSVRFASDWGNVGTFTIEINADKPKADEFIVGRFIQMGNSIDRQAIIGKVTRRMAVGDNGVIDNSLLVSGMQLKGLLYFSLVLPPGGVFGADDPNNFTWNMSDITYWENNGIVGGVYDVSGAPNVRSSQLPDPIATGTAGKVEDINGDIVYYISVTTGIWQWFDADGDVVDITTLDYYGTGISYDVYQDVSTETIMKDLVFNNRKVNSLPFQNIPQLDIEVDAVRGIIHEYESFRFKRLSDVLDYLSSASGLGWNLLRENGRLVFKVIEGVDRSAEQSENDRVVFAFNRGNVSRIEYVEDAMESNNQILVGGQGEGTERQLLLLGQFGKTGLNSQFGFVDARDVETLEGLETRGLEKIAERKSTHSISVTGFSKKVLVKLGTDYNLGDIVTIKIEEWNLTLHVRVTGVVERQTIDNAGTLQFEFGTKSLSLESLIRKNFSEIDNEVLK